MGARDPVLPPLTGVAARVDRALRNFLETFPFFAAAVLALAVPERGAATALGAQCHCWARVAYVPLYAAGVRYLRTLVWAVSVWGLLRMVLPPL